MSNLFCALQGIQASDGPDNSSWHVPYEENWYKLPFVLADQGDITTGFVWDANNYRYICAVPSPSSKVVLYFTLSFDMFIYRLNKPIGPYRWGVQSVKQWKGGPVDSATYPVLYFRASIYQGVSEEVPVYLDYRPVTGTNTSTYHYYSGYSSRFSGQLTGFIKPSYVDGDPRPLEFSVKIEKPSPDLTDQDESLYYIGSGTECTILPIVGV